MNKRYLISEVAKQFNVSKNKLRFYEKKGLIKPKRDDENNYRYYTEGDLIKLQAILLYRLLNIPINDIKDIINNNCSHNMLEHFNKQWLAVNDEIHRMGLIRNSLENIMDSIYDSNNVRLQEKIHNSIESMGKIYEIKESWKDRWNFDSWANTYDNSVKRNIGSTKIYKKYEEVLENVYRLGTKNTPINAKILDIGVGTGNLSKKFLENGYNNIIGLDQSREMLNVAKSKFPNLKLRLGEFLKIPFENNVFDLIVSTYAFHHLNEEEKSVAIREMLRVLKENGKIVIGDLMFRNEMTKKEIYRNFSKEQISEIEDEYYSNIELLKKEFAKYNKELYSYNIDKLVFVVEIH
ncbi:methyltransferase domain-containing protein [Wukongibacter sp. M2B1]|uniref:methyltransferase domain-containing protein n=1 Tax=Wukongibacter sp. M2B1 TaxID=3088895 RepID=UPI003D7A3B40